MYKFYAKCVNHFFVFGTDRKSNYLPPGLCSTSLTYCWSVDSRHERNSWNCKKLRLRKIFKSSRTLSVLGGDLLWITSYVLHWYNDRHTESLGKFLQERSRSTVCYALFEDTSVQALSKACYCLLIYRHLKPKW